MSKNNITIDLPLNQQPINSDEIDIRFGILAEEISNLKQIILDLQSYTMNVNKILFEEKMSFNLSTPESSCDCKNKDIGQKEVIEE